jgi:hypothetical protein
LRIPLLKGSRYAIETFLGQVKRTKDNLLVIKTIKVIIAFMNEKEQGEENINASPPHQVKTEGSADTKK